MTFARGWWSVVSGGVDENKKLNVRPVMINRHNYEEFFLLYVDKELNEVQCAEVEKFVQQNPDLGKELDMLKQSILTNDDVRFEAKDILYKKEAGISLTTYKEYFLLSIDKQLSEEEIAEVEKFVLKHPQLQPEFTLLQQTILPAETIKFDQKEILYRTEKKRRVIPFTLINMSAAAAIIGLVATVWMFTQNNNALVNNNNVATNQPIKKYSKPFNVARGSKAVADQPVALADVKDGKKIVTKAKTKTPSIRNLTNNTAFVNTTAGIKQNTKKALPKNDFADVQSSKLSEEKSALTINETNTNLSSNASSKTGSENAPKATFAANQNAEDQKPFVKEAVYSEMNNDDDGRSLYIGATEINKNKLRGLFKKAANFFNKESGKNGTKRTVQIASFEIKSK